MFSRLSSIAVIAFATLFAHTSVQASTAPTSKAAHSKKKSSKKSVKSTKSVVVVEDAPNVTDAVATDYECELGNKLTFYNRSGEEQSPALRWNNKLHKMIKIDTSTGAIRYENSNSGLVWIGLANKGMLLDAKKGQQLANECKNAEQKSMPPVETASITG